MYIYIYIHIPIDVYNIYIYIYVIHVASGSRASTPSSFCLSPTAPLFSHRYYIVLYISGDPSHVVLLYCRFPALALVRERRAVGRARGGRGTVYHGDGTDLLSKVENSDLGNQTEDTSQTCSLVYYILYTIYYVLYICLAVCGAYFLLFI